MLITSPSVHSVAETIKNLTNLLQLNQIEIFATIDHAQAARDAGLNLQDEVLLIFGNPKVGTILMQEKPTIGIDLPLKILVWQDKNKVTQVTFSDPTQLEKCHNIQQHRDILVKLKDLLNNLAEQASI